MAVRKNQPARVGFAAFLALISISATPVLAAPDRSICNDGAAPTLEVATTEFSRTIATDTDDATELSGRKLEFSTREKTDVDSDQSEQVDTAAGESDDREQREATVPADTGPLVHKRQMYRRDI